ncbi:MAG: hypothetical protein JOZ32_08850 [Bryobacterales bacterium]|nr:hypothetical protein [Bryobacterales bacterium]
MRPLAGPARWGIVVDGRLDARAHVKSHMFDVTGLVEAHRTFGEAFHMLF